MGQAIKPNGQKRQLGLQRRGHSSKSCMKGKGGVRMVFWNAAVDEEFT